MSLEWKYVAPLDESQLAKVEEHFGLSLPEDYKKSLAKCNQGKPILEKFATELEEERVLDYMIDLKEVVSVTQALSSEYGVDNLIPIARDPFGNLIAFSMSDRQINSVVFWDHEGNKTAPIASSFTEFLEKLY